MFVWMDISVIIHSYSPKLNNVEIILLSVLSVLESKLCDHDISLFI